MIYYFENIYNLMMLAGHVTVSLDRFSPAVWYARSLFRSMFSSS